MLLVGATSLTIWGVKEHLDNKNKDDNKKNNEDVKNPKLDNKNEDDNKKNSENVKNPKPDYDSANEFLNKIKIENKKNYNLVANDGQINMENLKNFLNKKQKSENQD